MSKISRSPDVGVSQRNSYLSHCFERGKEPSADYLDMFDKDLRHRLDQERDPAWQENNLEYDLRTTDWILEKARASEAYAQNLYAALCNNKFQKRDVMPILKDQVWSCTWRYAGGIVANMREQGDYMDWYCSGIRGSIIPDEDLSDRDRERIEFMNKYFESEGSVNSQIEEDLGKLGWNVLPRNIDDDI